MRKLYEICQSKAALLETEEYAHDAYYALDADTPAILFAPPDAGFRRCAEVAGYLAEIGCPLLVVSGAERRTHFPDQGITFTGLPGASTVETTLTYAVAAQALACQAGQHLGGAFYACNNPTRYARGDEQIYGSKRMDLEDV
jgi:glucosamine 6-phosphate synthetase-like amidotransferase/phosphosugar isomerase protein